MGEYDEDHHTCNFVVTLDVLYHNDKHLIEQSTKAKCDLYLKIQTLRKMGEQYVWPRTGQRELIQEKLSSCTLHVLLFTTSLIRQQEATRPVPSPRMMMINLHVDPQALLLDLI